MIIEFDNTLAKLVDATTEQIVMVRKHLTYKVDGYQFMRAFREHRWDGTRSIYIAASKAFPAGLAPEIGQLIYKATGDPVELRDLRKKPIPPSVWGKMKFPNGGELEAHQDEAVKRVLQATRGVVHHPVGSGKSITELEAIRRTGVPSLLLCQSKELLHQLYEAALECLPRNREHPIGIIGDGIWRPGFVTVATMQTIAGNLRAIKGKGGAINAAGADKWQRAAEFLKGIEGIHIDECHHLPAESYKILMLNLPNAYYRIGYSATPMRSGAEEQRLLVTGLTGPVISRRTSSDSIEFGRSVPVEMYLVESGGRRPDDKNYQQAVQTGIVNHEERNRKIVRLAELFGEQGPTVVLTERLESGRLIADMLASLGHEEVK